MLSILIVDDTRQKVECLRNFILQNFKEVKESEIDCADCIEEARVLMRDIAYDLVLLDLVIPRRHAQVASVENAVELLQIIDEDESVHTPAHILGITQMHKEDVNTDALKKFEDDLWKILYYGEEYNGWENKLKHQIQYLIDTKKRLYSHPVYMCDIAIIAALQTPEFWAIKRVLGLNDWETLTNYAGDTCGTYYRKQVQIKENQYITVVIAYQDQMASVASASLTTKIICLFRPRYLFMTGIAAAIKQNGIRYGDILVATEVWDGACGKYESGSFKPDPRQIPLDISFRTIINRLTLETDVLQNITKNVRSYVSQPQIMQPISIHSGPMASVPAVIADADKLKSIIEHSRKVIGIEMEAYGVFYAATRSVEPRPQIVASIKSVSDFANEHKSDDYQEYAAYVSAELIKYIILNELSYDS